MKWGITTILKLKLDRPRTRGSGYNYGLLYRRVIPRSQWRPGDRDIFLRPWPSSQSTMLNNTMRGSAHWHHKHRIEQASRSRHMETSTAGNSGILRTGILKLCSAVVMLENCSGSPRRSSSIGIRDPEIIVKRLFSSFFHLENLVLQLIHLVLISWEIVITIIAAKSGILRGRPSIINRLINLPFILTIISINGRGLHFRGW